jgi:ABC-type antimicrobial peptide transport system permease subunit
MLRWSLKNLFAEPLRLVYIEQMEADVWVMQKGVSNMHMASSLLWDWKADMVAKVPGVREVSSILYLNAAVKAGGRDWFSYIIGLPPDPQYGGPWDMAEGKPGPAAGEAVIPEVIAQLAGLKLGDTLTIIDKQLVIVGLTRGTFSMSSAVVFVSREDLGDLMEAEDQISYIMVKAQPGISQTVLATRIKEEVEKVNALPNEALIASDRQMALQMGAEIVHMMTVIGTLLAMMIVAFTAYSQTAHKQRELAIAKAVLIAYTLLPLLPELAPQITLSVTPQTLLSLGAVVLPVAILACLGPVIKVARVDPMTVFQR